MNFDLDFYKGKKVFVTGHTGFKGSWLCKMLVNVGAIVTGYSLNPPTSTSLFEIAGIEQDVHSVIGDIRDFKTLKAAFDEAQPEIVLHLAAQPIVRDSYKNPAYTYETNVMGTVNILECVRNSSCVKSFLNVTTDKVYLNKEWAWAIGRMKNWTVMIRTPTLSPVLSWLHTPIKTASLTMTMLQFLRLVQGM